jgi:MFS family permease
MRVTVTEQDLADAATAGVITAGQAHALWDRWSAVLAAQPPIETHETPRFKMAHLLYYFGGLIAITAISFFITIAWGAFGAWPLLVFGLGIMLLSYALTRRFVEVDRQPIAAGTMAALLITAVPMVVFALQHVLGAWEGEQSYRDYHYWIDWRWILMELATLAAGAVVLWRFRLPFAMLPIAVTLWYMSMDVAAYLAQDSEGWFTEAGWKLRATVSMLFGFAMVAIALWIELRQHATASAHPDRRDFAFWLYLVGALTFWGGLTSQDSGSEFGKLIYALINLGLIGLGTMLSRRVFVVFGSLGVMGYLGYLSYEVFEDSLLFPAALGALGIGIVFVGIWWSKHEAELHRVLSAWLPAPLRRAIEAR